MRSITIENFRCFGEKQTAHLAPLTLLVGENSTGKTSFLALLRVLSGLVHTDIPDFKRPPYDLGSFDDIAHYRGGRGGRAETFSVEVVTLPASARSQVEWKFAIQFDKQGTAPVPVYRRTSLSKTDNKNNRKDTWVAVDSRSSSIKIGTKRGIWDASEIWDAAKRYTLMHRRMISAEDINRNMISAEGIIVYLFIGEDLSKIINRCKSEGNSPTITADDVKDFESFVYEMPTLRDSPYADVFASAPVRSQPHRTYDPARPAFDPEGDYVPMFLAELSSKQPKVWSELKHDLENFGRSSGLFEEIRIRHFGTSHSNPFQVQVRKSGQTRRKGPWRNLVDVGYGVSQALPIITELLRHDVEPQRSKRHLRQFLLQQPEVHLHPSAQAALGSLFCQVAGPRRQLIVETHSDNLMDRVRMDVRDGRCSLKPEDVSILFFERRGLDVRIHSLRLDEEGNVLGAPDGYRQFFMDEMTRSLWPERSSEGSQAEA